MVESEHLDRLDRAAEDIFGTTEVPRKVVLDALIDGHPDVSGETPAEA